MDRAAARGGGWGLWWLAGTRRRTEMARAAERPAVAPVIDGNIDGVDGAFDVYGWVRCTGRPPEPVMVGVFEDAEKVAEQLACLFRKYLADAGISGGKCGFRIALPSFLFDGSTIPSFFLMRFQRDRIDLQATVSRPHAGGATPRANVPGDAAMTNNRQRLGESRPARSQ